MSNQIEGGEASWWRLPTTAEQSYDSYMALALAVFAAGLFAWTFLEYVIHGWMSHVFKTFASPMHWGHHRDPRGVFTVGAWLPSISAWLLMLWFFGWATGVIFYSGVLAGFIGYEILHYRMHFAVPASALERSLRTHHLVHHMRAPDQCFGVSTRLWDRMFGSEPAPEEFQAMAAAVADLRPLTGKSNFSLIFRLGSRPG